MKIEIKGTECGGGQSDGKSKEGRKEQISDSEKFVSSPIVVVVVVVVT